MTENVRAHLTVAGVVQMVGFRSFTLRVAREYGLTGWVRNMPDGRVEIEAEGDKSLLGDFVKEIRIGPPPSRVTALDVQWGPYTGAYTAFDVRL
jgi:acylphosphatase